MSKLGLTLLAAGFCMGLPGDAQTSVAAPPSTGSSLSGTGALANGLAPSTSGTPPKPQALAPIRRDFFGRAGASDGALSAYLDRVRAESAGAQPTDGGIWTDNGRLTRLATDVRAMRPHDLISVVVTESLDASTDGTVKNSRASNAQSGISGLIGKLHAGNALQNLITQNSTSGLNAQGAVASSSRLNTILGGEVIEVLPNGTLVIEAVREVEFSQQTETVLLRGLVRPEDISQQNQVLSTAISSLELEVRGKGVINDYTHRQNALVRLVMSILVF